MPPVVAPAPTVEWISSMKRIGIGRLVSACDDGLEAFLEVAAESRAGEERARVEREDLGALEQIRDVVLEQPRGEPLGERRLPDAGIADEHRVVLAAPAENLHGALELGAAPDQRVELAVAGAFGEVDGVRGERIARRAAAAFAGARLGVTRRFAGARPAPPAEPC